jgi:integrase
MLADGTPIKPNSLTQAVRRFMLSYSRQIGLHGLRHSHSSHMLASNVHPKIVQERLGHSSISVTMDIYSHLMPNMQAEAAAKVDDAMRAAIRKRAGWRSRFRIGSPKSPATAGFFVPSVAVG